MVEFEVGCRSFPSKSAVVTAVGLKGSDRKKAKDWRRQQREPSVGYGTQTHRAPHTHTFILSNEDKAGV